MKIFTEESLAGKKALVVGGSGGIGAAVALELARRGAVLGVHGGSSQERLDRVLGEIRAIGGRAAGSAQGFLLDLSISGAADSLLARFPSPDILVCAWGPFKRVPLDQMEGHDWEFLIKNNIILPGTMISRVISSMIYNRWGRILLFGGTNTDTIRGFTSTCAYSAAKTALGVLAKSVARYAGPQGVCCNVICPGLTDTEYLDEAGRQYNREHNTFPIRPEDIARLAVEILAHPTINGAIVPIDEGLVI